MCSKEYLNKIAEGRHWAECHTIAYCLYFKLLNSHKDLLN